VPQPDGLSGIDGYAAELGGLCKTGGFAVHPADSRNLKRIGDTPPEITSNGSSGR
jgi:hypothetical protein